MPWSRAGRSRPACRRASTSATTWTLTSTSISMASRNPKRRWPLALGFLIAAPLAAQAPAPLRLSFADAVRRAAGGAPAVELASLRTDEAEARVRQARSALLPGFSVGAGWVDPTFNHKTLGIQM